jgi:hypothetical protein
MRRCYTRVKCNNVVAGVDVFIANFLFVYFLMSRYNVLKQPKPTLHDRVHETGSTVACSIHAAGGCLYLPL